MSLLHPRPLILIQIFFFIAFALCSPVPQGIAWVTVTATVTAGALNSTPTADVGCGKITSTKGSFLGIPVQYRIEPSGRGTLEIFISFSATYIFCVWTTVAPGVGETGKRNLRVWYKLLLTSIAIIVPASVMIYAFDEWRQANILVHEWNTHFKLDISKMKKKNGQGGEDEQKGGGGVIPKSNLTPAELNISTAFFILMGGFRVHYEHSNWEPDERELKHRFREEHVYARPILTPAGFRRYLNESRITGATFSQADILDKGKSNHIAKIFAVIYGFWFRKPLDVGVPTTILLDKPLGEGKTDLGDGDIIETHEQCNARDEGATSSPIYPTSYGGSTVYTGGASCNTSPVPGPGSSNGKPSHRTLSTVHDPDVIANITHHAPAGDNDHSMGYTDKPVGDTNKRKGDKPRRPAFVFANRDSLYEATLELPLKSARQIQTTWVPVAAKAFLDVVTHVQPVDYDGTKKPAQEHKRWFTVKMIVAQGFLVVLVAILHLGAWNTKSPFDTERWFWRASCLSMIVFPTLIVAIVCFNKYHIDMFDILWRVHLGKDITPRNVIPFALKEIHKAIIHHSLPKGGQKGGETVQSENKDNTAPKPLILKMVQEYIMFWSCIIAGTLYVFASLFITVESFFSIRWLDAEYFQAPAWSSIILHL
ncbi:hypothetical protein DFP73DRAFT_591493 [Morchella snyderi]|nr:hypothetical protein DFP73DRAFT_591493 [Morchella snyderi]